MTFPNRSQNLCPVVTTFYRDRRVDVASFAANVRALTAGCTASSWRSTGGAALLDRRTRRALIDAARELTPKDKWLIVGTGAESTRNCLRQTHDAAKRGADAVLVVAPHYYGPAMTGPALMQHYWRVAEESPVPVILYNIPKYMHFSLAPNLVAELARHENVIGIKDSSGNKELLSAFLAAKSSTFSVLVGNAQLFHRALMNNATGGILTAEMFAPALALEIYNLHRAAIMPGRSGAGAPHAAGRKIVGELGWPA